MTNEKLFTLLMICLIIHTIIDCVPNHYKRNELKRYIDSCVRRLRLDFRDIAANERNRIINKIEEEDKLEEIMVNLNEVIDTISKMKKEK